MELPPTLRLEGVPLSGAQIPHYYPVTNVLSFKIYMVVLRAGIFETSSIAFTGNWHEKWCEWTSRGPFTDGPLLLNIEAVHNQ